MSEIILSNINTIDIETPIAGTGTIFLDRNNKIIFKKIQTVILLLLTQFNFVY